MSNKITPEQYRSLAKSDKKAKKQKPVPKPSAEVNLDPDPSQEHEDNEPLMCGQHTESQIRQVFDCITDAKVLKRLSQIGFVFVEVGAEKMLISDGKNKYIIKIVSFQTPKPKQNA